MRSLIQKRAECENDNKATHQVRTELLDHATNNLLRAVKQKILKKEGHVDYDKLRKEGYSDRFLAKVEAA